MDVRSLVGSLQLPITGLGALATVSAVGMLLSLETPARPDIPHGFAILFLYVLAWAGITVTSLGLAIPPGEGYGIRFRRGQRLLFVLAAVASVASAVVPFVALTLIYSQPNVAVYSWLGTITVAVLALVGGVGWRAVDAARARIGE